jgi:hypothetical protein
MHTLENLEIHVTHGCNLTCESCSHFSNHGHKGIVSLQEAAGWMGAWKHRLSPSTFSLLGGEPTIHHQLPQFVLLARDHWPHARLRLVTNGFFLHRHPRLPVVLKATDTVLCLSIHHDTSEYRSKIAPIRQLLSHWQSKYGIPIEYFESHKYWTRRYHGFGAEMQPYEDQQPRRSWEQCRARYCRQLFDGKLWKCSPLAYLRLQSAKYLLSNAWSPYLDYQPLKPACTDEELRAFLSREEEDVCNMCPAFPERFELPNPLPGMST